MWPQHWLGELYSKLWVQLGHDAFTLSKIAGLVGTEGKARVAVSRLKKHGLIYVFSVAKRRRQYVLGDPLLLPYLAAGRLSNLHLLTQSQYTRLIALFSAEAIRAFPQIRSIVIYGSLSRGVAERNSDVDLLILMDSQESVGERIQRLSRLEDLERIRKELDWLDDHGIYTHISILPLTEDEVARFPPVLLDILEDGIPVADDGTWLKLASTLKVRLAEAGAKRVFLSPNEWYWDLAPRLRAGEVYAV